MWWKLGILSIITAALILIIIPLRTHALLIDPANSPSPTKWTLSFMVSNMYLTPGTTGLICVLLAVASYIGFRIVRSA